MSWRPEGWQTIKEQYYPDDPWQGFEAGADAMLMALRELAYSKVMVGENYLSSISHPDDNWGKVSGVTVFIPDDEEVIRA